MTHLYNNAALLRAHCGGWLQETLTSDAAWNIIPV